MEQGLGTVVEELTAGQREARMEQVEAVVLRHGLRLLERGHLQRLEILAEGVYEWEPVFELTRCANAEAVVLRYRQFSERWCQ